MSIPHELHETASRQFGTLTLQQLQAAGVNKAQITYRVKQGAFIRKKGGVVAIAGSRSCWEQRIAAAALAAHPLGGASHRSAARFWQFRTVDEHVEVSIRYPRRLVLPDVHVHRSVDLVDSDLTWYEAIPITTPERTLCDLGLIFPQSEVMRILRDAIATGLVNRRDVWRIRKRVGRPGRNGAGVIDRCLQELPEFAAQTESGLEVMFLEMCENHLLPQPTIQLPVVARGHRYRLDFAYPERRLVIEVDGRGTHSSAEQIASDGGRQNHLVAAGWKPLRFTYEQLKSSPEVCAAILQEALRF